MQVAGAIKTPPRLGVAYLAAGITVLIWGATPTITKVVVGEFDPLFAAILRTVVAAAITLPLALYYRMPLPSNREDWVLLFVTSIAGFVGFTLFFNYGVANTSATHAAIINAGIPVFVGLIGSMFDRKTPGRMWVIGASVAMAGEALLILDRSSGAGQVSLYGDVMCILSSACAALGYVTGAKLSLKFRSLHVTFWSLIIAGLIQLPILIWAFYDGGLAGKSETAWGGVLFLAVMTSIVGYIFWYKALAVGGVVKMSVAQFAMPIVSVSMVVFFLEEALTLQALISIGIIIAGIAITRLK